jgi:hypothetical protein
VLALSISLPPKLRMTSAQTEHMPFYLRIFFRVLASWVHGEKSWSRRGVVPDSTISPSCPSYRRTSVRRVPVDAEQAADSCSFRESTVCPGRAMVLANANGNDGDK